MTKLKKLRIQLLVMSLAAFVFGSIGLVRISQAYESYKNGPKVQVMGNYIEAQPPMEPVAPVVEAAPAEQAGGAAGVADFTSNYFCVNKDCEYHIVQTYIDASTTFVSIADPFLTVTTTGGDIIIADSDGTATTSQTIAFGFTGATSTVERLRLSTTGAATSTYGISCATAATPFATSSLSQTIINTPSTVTGTYMVETGTFSFNAVDGTSGFLGIPANTTTTLSKAMLTPNRPYLICKVGGVASGNTAFTGATNTFDGKATAIIGATR